MERIMKYINRVYRASLIDRDNAFSKYGLCGPHISYIRLICSNEALSQEDISKYLYVNKSTVARHVNTLEKNGFLIRQVDKEDKRIKRIYPTEKAKKLFPVIMDYLEEWNNKITNFIKKEDENEAINLLKNLAKQASESIDISRDDLS